MKSLLLTFTAIIGLFSLSTAHAFLGFSLGAHAGIMEFDEGNIDSEAIIGANLGYEVANFVVVALDADLEIQQSIDDFEVGSQDVSYDSRALYLTAKTFGPLYAIGRIGFLDAEFNDNSDDASVVTVGVGFSLGIQWELTLANLSFDDAGDAQQVNLRIGF